MDPKDEYQQDTNGQLPPGALVEDAQVEQLPRFVAEKLLEISDQEQPKMFSREDILGNILSWEKVKLMRLHQLQKACGRLKLKDAVNFFQKEEKKILGLSRSVNGFQQKIVRTAINGSPGIEKDEERTFGFMPKWKWNR